MHDHEHEHEHEREHEITVSHHEGAVIISAQISLENIERADAAIATNVLLGEIAQQIESGGGIIGHLKASLTGTHTTMLSLTEPGMVSQKHYMNPDMEVKIAAIFYPAGEDSEEDLINVVSEKLLTLAERE